MTATEAKPRVYTVGQLGRLLRAEVERASANLQVGGEIVNLKQVESGHAYFTLRDEREEAAVDCVMYRSADVRARRLLSEGARLVLLGKATFWAPRGRLQFVVENARPAGRGAILEALEKRRAALAKEGLFDPARKRPLPSEARVVGLVTSAQGAALHDIVKVAFARGRVRFVLVTAPVQGTGAAEAMSRALRLVAKHPEVQAIVLSRGGGSADDLSAFNEEVLVRAVAACPVPVVSAVGHEIDQTLVDLAADVRAATPSQAAELLVPDDRARAAILSQLRVRLRRSARRMIDERQQRVDVARSELASLASRRLRVFKDGVVRLERRLHGRHPSTVLSIARTEVSALEARLSRAARSMIDGGRSEVVPIERLRELFGSRIARGRLALATAAGRLDAMSPLAVLGRGYALVRRAGDRALLRAARDVSVGDAIDVELARGRLHASVTSTDDEPASDEPRDR